MHISFDREDGGERSTTLAAIGLRAKAPDLKCDPVLGSIGRRISSPEGALESKGVSTAYGPGFNPGSLSACHKHEANFKSAVLDIATMRLNQVTLFAADLAESIAFYETLGLKLIVSSPHYARFELPEGESTFSLHAANGPIPRENAPQIYFECADVDGEVRRLKRAGLTIEREPAAQTWLWREAWLRDPAGNAICLFQAGENRRNPPWRLKTAPAERET